MAVYQPGERASFEAAADLSAKRYHIVKMNSDRKLVLATDATDAIVGVLDSDAKLGHTADVVLINGTGSFKVKAGANIAADALITTDANGQAVTATTSNRVIGRARYAAVTGEIFEYFKSNEKA